jgi:hypothetical protein
VNPGPDNSDLEVLFFHDVSPPALTPPCENNKMLHV